MKNFKLNFKSIVRSKARWLLTLIAILTLGVGQMWASTTATLYYAVGADVVGSNTPKCWFNAGYDQSSVTVTFAKTAYTKDGKLIYSVSVTANHDNIDDMYFKPKGDSSDGEQRVMNGWVALSTRSGQMYVHNTGWTSYSTDASYKVYFARTTNWDYGVPYVYTWNSSYDYNAGFPGQQMEELTGKTFNGKKIYVKTIGKRYTGVKFSNNSSNQTADMTMYSTNANKMYYYDGSADRWVTLQYDVTLNKDGGSGTGTTSIIATCGSAMPGSKTAPGTALSGYSFQGYYTAVGGGGTQYYTSAMASANTWPSDGSGPTTLYAKWTQTLNLNGNGATSAGTTSVTATYKGGITSISSNPSKTGYDFQGYYPNANGTGSQVINTSKALQTNVTDWTNSSTKWIHTGSSTLYAKWTQTVTLNSNTSYGGKSGGNGSAGVIFNGAKTSYTAAQANSASYALKGYYTATTDGDLVIDKDGNIVADVEDWTDEYGNWIHDDASTLYAQWKTTYTLSYDGNGNTGGDVPGDSEETMNSIVTAADPEDLDLERTGYTFTGWNDEEDGSGDLSVGAGEDFTITGNTTLYAQWSENTHNVTVQYKCSTAVIKTATTKSNVGEVTAASQAAPAIDGYTFSAWTIESGITKTSGALTDGTLYFKTNSSGTYTITANYTAKSCNLVKLSSGKDGSETTTGTDAGAMTFDPTTKAYYIDITTTASPYYFRFTYNSSTKYCSDWKDSNYDKGKEVAANTEGSKVACDQSVGGWTNKPAMYYPGATGSKLRVWFDYQNKKVWTTASLNEQFVLRGSKYDNSDNGGMPGWDATTSYFSGLASGSSGTKTVTLEAGVKYKVKAYDMFTGTYKGKSSAGEQEMANNTYYAVGSGGDFYFTSTAAGTYTFTYHTSSGLKVQFPVSYTVNFNAETFLNGGASHSTSTTGGTVAAVDGNETTFTSGSKIISGGTVVITATKNTGYDFDGFFTNANCTTEVSGAGVSISDNVLTFSSINEAKTAYAKFSEKMTTVNLVSTAGGKIQINTGSWVDAGSSTTAGKTTTRNLKAVPNTGYYFAGWERSATPDFHLSGYGEANTTVTLTGDGAGTAGTLTANFALLDTIYFYNSLGWANVYVYFNPSWDHADNPAWSKGVYPAGGIGYATMTNLGSNIWYALIPRAFTSNNYTKIAFSDVDMHEYTNFSGHNAIWRDDWNDKLDMYIPCANTTGGATAKGTGATSFNSTTYYNEGFWTKKDVKVNDGLAYYLKNSDASTDIQFEAVADNSRVGKVTWRIDDTSDKTYYICSASGREYSNNALTFTSTKLDGTLYVYNDRGYFTLKPSSEGLYSCYLNLEPGTGHMTLSVGYPVSVGDYRLKHTYNSGAKTTYSDVIKSSDASSSNTVSMFLSKDGSPTLVLQRCSTIVSGNPVWTTGYNDNLNGVQSTVSSGGNGVYQFDVTINTTTYKVTNVANTKLYDGAFYIKTNVAPGGWANYKQNIMEENSINAADFDYYFCKYIADAGTNIKCVIANDYNNAVSDTLVGDATLGVDVQTLPRKGSVRFSYDSKTNTLNRAYISGSSDWATYFLYLQAGSAVIKDLEGTAFTDNKVKFTDGGNWMYTLTLQAEEGARIKLVSNYYTGSTTKTQYFKGAAGVAGHYWDNEYTELLIGGSTSKWYTLKIIYDFKTNHLLSAWSPSGDIDATINLHTDVLLIHNRKKLANPGDEVSLINLTGGDGVKDIDKVYSALRFQKTSDDNYVGLQETSATTAASYYRYNYWISFPYDVKMTDIFGINGYGSKWRIQYYDGKERAEKGWYKGDGTTSFWKTMPMSDTEKLNKGEGYVLQLSPSAFKATGSGSLWELSNEVYLYFPSKANFGTIGLNTSTVTLPSEGYVCTRGAFTDGSGMSHDVTDSYWHVFGIPTFSDATGTTGTGHNYYDGADDGDEPEDHNITNGTFYFYKYENSNNSSKYNEYTATSSSGFTFQPMHAYMIQMYGTLNFATNSVPASVAARRTAETANYNVQVELQSEDVVRDQTFVTLRDSAEVGFAFNEDLMKIHNDGKTNIYSYAGPYDVAANILPIENRTVALGIEVAANGSYTFHMPSNFSGTVTLIDTYAQTRTNLALEDYEVTLEKGTYEGRFYLELDINKVTTDVVTVSGDWLEECGIRKFIYDNQLYIMKNGIIYDARGNRVK